VQLSPLAKATTDALECKLCGAELRVVPGCSYAERDREAFGDLSNIVAEGCVTTIEARSLAEQLERAMWSGAYSGILERLAVRLPGLLPLQVAVGKNYGAQRRVVSLLKTILDALATARRTSAAYPIASLPEQIKTQKG
jgi:hypothetical protein